MENHTTHTHTHTHTHSMCCSEVCRVYKRRAKLRRDRLNSDEISLLPTQGNDRQEVEGVDGQGYGNMLTNGPSCVNMGFKVSVGKHVEEALQISMFLQS